MERNTRKIGKPCIYYIKNKMNNKVYIGSAIGHYQRKGQHFYLLRNNKHFNSHLQSSWNKYGENNFEFKVLEFVKDVSLLKIKEEKYIKIFNANINTNGFNYRIYCSTNLGVKRSLESRTKQSNSKKGVTPNIDYNHVAMLNNKAVTATDKKTNEKHYFISVKEAGEKLNVHRTSISKVLHNKIKSAGGFYWDFTEESVSNNSVNSGKILNKDNPEPSSLNGVKVNEKVQRLTDEEPTNNSDTSAEHPIYKIKSMSVKEWIKFYKG